MVRPASRVYRCRYPINEFTGRFLTRERVTVGAPDPERSRVNVYACGGLLSTLSRTKR
jgi:hypothetical protein